MTVEGVTGILTFLQLHMKCKSPLVVFNDVLFIALTSMAFERAPCFSRYMFKLEL